MTETLVSPDEDLLPYDDAAAYPRFWDRMLRTFRAFVTHPSAAAERIPNGDFKRDGLSFYLAFAWPLTVLTEGVNLLAHYSPWVRSHLFPMTGAKDVTVLMSVLAMVFFPIGAWVGFWIPVALWHGSLWIWRGLHDGLEIHQTARAVGFAFGLTCAIPVLGWAAEVVFAHGHSFPYFGILARVLDLGLIGYLLAKTHRTALWRGIAASATPFFLILGLVAWLTSASFLKALLQ